MGVRSFITNYALNRGILSPLGLARFDLKRYALAAQVMVNWMARTLGSMMLRPGTAYIDTISSGNNPAYHIPFIFSIPDTAIIEMSFEKMRVRVAEAIITRGSVATQTTNGTFNTNITGWTDASQTGASTTWVSGNYAGLTGTNFNHGILYQNVTVASGDQNKEHALHLIIKKGYIDLLVGTALNDGSYIFIDNMGPGEYSLAFTPTGNFTIEMRSSTIYQTLVTSIVVEAAGSMAIATPYLSADLPNIRWDQSADEVFLACKGYAPYQINRYSTRSWALAQYLPKNGPMGVINTDPSILIGTNSVRGDISLYANNPYFNANMVGSLLAMASDSQYVFVAAAGTGQWSNPIEVVGVGTQRIFSVTITGTWSATVTVQQSVGAPGAWEAYATYTTNQSGTQINDADNNQIIYYRIGIDAGNYTSGSAACSLSFAGGSITGIAQLDAFINSTSMSAHTLQDFGSGSPTQNWTPGVWSADNGYPTVPLLYEGRLWWLGNDYIIGSVSDAYASFDANVVGDSGPIIRTLAQGPVSTIQWALGLQRMLVGCDGCEYSIQSDALNSPLTPTNFNSKSPSTRGAAAVAGVKIDTNGIFVQRGDPTTGNMSGTRLIQMSFQGIYAVVDYSGTDLTQFCPEVLQAGSNRICVQRKIDTRIHCVMDDGTVSVLIYDPIENERCWMQVNLPGGFVEDAFVMPGAVSGGIEDSVYYSVKRTIGGTDYRYLERWALESECTGLQMAKNLDSHIVYSGGLTEYIGGLSSLGSQQVGVWGWNTITPYTVTLPNGETQQPGINMGMFTPSVSGYIGPLPSQVTNAIVGIPYTAQWQSVKLIQTVQADTTMFEVKSIDRLGVMLANAQCQGLQYGRNFNDLDNLPQVEGGMAIDLNTVWPAAEYQDFTFQGVWETDSRLCLQAQSPNPVTVLAAKIGVTTK